MPSAGPNAIALGFCREAEAGFEKDGAESIKHIMASTQPRDMNRRDFLRQAGVAVGCAAGGVLEGCQGAKQETVEARKDEAVAAASQKVSIVVDPGDATAASGPGWWAVGQLREALKARGVEVGMYERVELAPRGNMCVVAAGGAAAVAQEVLVGTNVSLPEGPESLVLMYGRASGRSVLLACGSDVRGLVYAVLELADGVTYASRGIDGLDLRYSTAERPANTIRSITRLFASDVEDKGWFNDRAFWQRYLTMLAWQRFNRFSLTLGLGYDFPRDIRDAYFHFAYPFLVSVPGYEVRATGLTDAERTANLEMLRFISDETAARGLHFQLGLWTHAYEWADSPNANHRIEGLNAGNHAAYCRDALQALLRACPSIAGVTFRVHGESGVAEGSYAFWKTVFEGVVQCGRRVEIDMHAKGMDQEMIDVALATGMPVNISPKYWAEHMGLPYHQAAIRPTEIPREGRQDAGFFARSSGSRSFLRYGYGDLLAEGRRFGVLHRIWPGTQRLLMWGDPLMAAAYGRVSSFCGSAGVEIMEPLSFKGRKGSGLPGGRDGYADASVRATGGDWEKYSYAYRLWGRLLYNPDAKGETWRRFLRREYGDSAPAAEAALAHASRILPLITTAHTPSAANNNYWPEMYVNMSIVDATKPGPYGDTPSPKRFGRVSPLDPQLFHRVDDYVEELLKGEVSGKYSPLEVAQWLEELAEASAGHLKEALGRAGNRDEAAYRRLAVDVAIQSGIGRFFAWKFRAAVLWGIYEHSGEASALDEALKAYRTARGAWLEMAGGAQSVYVADITFGLERQLRGHWVDRLTAIDQDIADMEKTGRQAAATGSATRVTERLGIAEVVRGVLGKPQRASMGVGHTPPGGFARGQVLRIEMTAGGGAAEPRPAAVRLCYRHVNQAETWRTVAMQGEGNRYSAVIAGEYTGSAYPLAYYFELRDGDGRAWLWPGFEAELMNQPYVVVWQR